MVVDSHGERFAFGWQWVRAAGVGGRTGHTRSSVVGHLLGVCLRVDSQHHNIK